MSEVKNGTSHCQQDVIIDFSLSYYYGIFLSYEIILVHPLYVTSGFFVVYFAAVDVSGVLILANFGVKSFLPNCLLKYFCIAIEDFSIQNFHTGIVF